MSDRKLALTVLFTGAGNLASQILGIDKASNGAHKRMKAMSDAVRAQGKQLREVQDQLKSASGNVTDLVDAERRLQGQLDKTTSKLQAQKKAMARQYRADATGSRLRADGQGQMLVGAAIAAPLILAGQQAAAFQDGMLDIQQKADLSDAATKRMASNIMVAARAAKQLPEDMRQGVDTLAGMGMSPEQATLMIAPIGKAATAYKAQIADLASASFAAADNLKVPAQETARVLDIMASAGKQGAFEMRDMAQYFPALTASAHALGQNGVPAVADLAAALQIARKGAGDAGTAANNLQNLLDKINSNETVKNFSKMGVDLNAALATAKKQGKSPIEAIVEATKKATKGDNAKIGLLFTDAQAKHAITPLLENLVLYQQIRATAMKSAGTVDADFAKRAQNASANTRALMGSLSALAITIGDKLLPKITPLIDKAGLIITRVAEWTDKHPKLTDALVTGAAAVAALNLAMGAGKVVYGSIVGPLTAAGNAYTFLKNSSMIASVVSAVSGGLATAWGVVTTAAVPFTASMFSAAAGIWAVAWPVLAVIAAIALLVAAVVAVVWAFKHWDKIVAFVSGVWDRITQVFKSIDWLKLGGDILMGLANGLLGGIPHLLIALGKVAMAGVGYFKKVLGIKSPSRVFMAMGGHITEGLDHGIRKGAPGPIGQARALAAGVAMAAAALPLSAGAGGAAGGGVAMYVQPGAIVIHAAPGQSADDIAAAVEAVLNRKAQQAASRARSAYRDDAE